MKIKIYNSYSLLAEREFDAVPRQGESISISPFKDEVYTVLSVRHNFNFGNMHEISIEVEKVNK